jgi:dsRNA-specific ribonuclease
MLQQKSKMSGIYPPRIEFFRGNDILNWNNPLRLTCPPQALAHPSWQPFANRLVRSKRLAFFGDAILDMVLSEALLNALPDAD